MWAQEPGVHSVCGSLSVKPPASPAAYGRGPGMRLQCPPCLRCGTICKVSRTGLWWQKATLTRGILSDREPGPSGACSERKGLPSPDCTRGKTGLPRLQNSLLAPFTEQREQSGGRRVCAQRPRAVGLLGVVLSAAAQSRGWGAQSRGGGAQSRERASRGSGDAQSRGGARKAEVGRGDAQSQGGGAQSRERAKGSLRDWWGWGWEAITLQADKNAEKERLPWEASAQLQRHCGPHNMVRARGTGDPRVAFGGSHARGHADAMTEGATNMLGGGVTTSAMANGLRAAGEPWVGPAG